jgi:hypothetical protein
MLRSGDREIADNIVSFLGPLVDGHNLCRLPPPPINREVRQLLVETDTYIELRQFDAALETATAAVERAAAATPCPVGGGHSLEGAQAHFHLGHVLGKLERWQQARENLRTAVMHAHGCGDVWTAYDVHAYETFAYAHGDPPRLEIAQLRLDDAYGLLAPAGGSSEGLRHAEWWRQAGLLAAAGDSPNYTQAIANLMRSEQILTVQQLRPFARIVQVKHNIGTIQQQAGHYADAERTYREITTLLRDGLGAEHPHTQRVQALVDVNRGLLALDAEDFEQADALLSSAATHGDPKVAARAYAGWAQARLQSGLAEDTSELAHRFLEWFERHPNLPDSVRAESLISIGQLLTQQDMREYDGIAYRAGLNMLRGAIELTERAAPQHSQGGRYILAAALYEDQQYAEAQSLVEQIGDVSDDPDLRQAVSELREKIRTVDERSRKTNN